MLVLFSQQLEKQQFIKAHIYEAGTINLLLFLRGSEPNYPGNLL